MMLRSGLFIISGFLLVGCVNKTLVALIQILSGAYGEKSLFLHLSSREFITSRFLIKTKLTK